MALLARNRSHSEILQFDLPSNDWIGEAFERYQVPSNLGKDIIDPVDGHILQCQVRYLGPASFKCGILPNVFANFYEVTKSEISEVLHDKKIKQIHEQVHGDIQMDHHDVDLNNSNSNMVTALEGTTESISETPTSTSLATVHHHEQSSTNGVFPTNNLFTTNSAVMALPPKKRKRRRVVHHCVIFSITNSNDNKDDHRYHQNNSIHNNNNNNKDMKDGSSLLVPNGVYYIFPNDAMIEAINNTTPFQILCTFQPSKFSASIQRALDVLNSGSKEDETNIPRTKLEEFAVVCSSSSRLHSTTSSPSLRDPSQRRLTDPGQKSYLPTYYPSQDVRPINIKIIGASSDIYYSLKHTVSVYESLCQKMVDLSRLHIERLEIYKNQSMVRPENYPINNNTQINHLHQQQGDAAKNEQEPIDTVMYDQQQEQCENEQENTTVFSSKRLSVTMDNANESWGSSDDNTADKDYTPAKKRKPKRTNTSAPRTSQNNEQSSGKKCLYCGSKSTPMWRRGPKGAGTLCNACGVKWKHGKILADVPTQLESSTSSSNNNNNSKEKSNKSENTKRRKGSNNNSGKKEKRNSKKHSDDHHSPSVKTIKTDNNNNHTEENVLEGSLSSSSSIKYNHQHHWSQEEYESDYQISEAKMIRQDSRNSYQINNQPSHSHHQHHNMDNGIMMNSTSYHSTSSSSQQLSSSSDSFSPLESFTSSPNSSPPMSMDSHQHQHHHHPQHQQHQQHHQQHHYQHQQRLLDISFAEKLGLDNSSFPLTAGADDVEAAAVLTLLKQADPL
ncbi:unnamed protein product [Cunninghamella blakesleeana]